PYVSCGGVTPVLIAHWNGAHWSVVSDTPDGLLHGVAAVSSHDIWAVGDTQPLHWNGTRWSPSSLPTGSDYRNLLGVAAHGSHDVWAVGSGTGAQVEGAPVQVTIFHWNGSAWSASPGVTPGLADNELYSVATVTTGEVWAVGYYDAYYSPSDSHQALI